MPPALEMGRSFVQPEYQRHPASLFLLWKGIGHFLVQHPRYKILLGPVSISKEYSHAARQVIVQYLQQTLLHPELSRRVTGRHPFFVTEEQGAVASGPRPLAGMDEVSRLVEEVCPGCHGVPVLLRHYLKLGGQVLAFSEDPDFNDVLDVLLVVDFRCGDARVLGKYMGRDGARSYLGAAAEDQPAAV